MPVTGWRLERKLPVEEKIAGERNSGKGLKEYPVEACKLHLSVLDLSNNSLSGLPPQIGMMTTLRKLLLTGNPLRSLRSNLVCGPTATLLKYLRGRISSDESASASAQPSSTDDLLATAARLSLSSKELSLRELSLDHVPDVVLESVDVVKVDLSKNFIKELPEKLSCCSSLKAMSHGYGYGCGHGYWYGAAVCDLLVFFVVISPFVFSAPPGGLLPVGLPSSPWSMPSPVVPPLPPPAAPPPIAPPPPAVPPSPSPWVVSDLPRHRLGIRTIAQGSVLSPRDPCRRLGRRFCAVVFSVSSAALSVFSRDGRRRTSCRC
ncbi:Plant intracellular Ras-group-related LRR protein 6 [Nymphaea thermarum]|nr:Plant intracellular Ras-group-related LRR protein 6 [Nymphaea thermarum]